MASPSKENRILEIILENSPLKHWHFEEFVRKTDMTRAAVNKWLKRYQNEGLIKRVKERGKFPYFTCGVDNPVYKGRKKLYGLILLYKSGLVNRLLSLKKVRAAIIFGSIARGDWYRGSDIDIFLYGEAKGIEKHKFELKLKRDIEFHIFKSKQEIKKVRTGLIRNIVNGYIVKGSIQDFAEVS